MGLKSMDLKIYIVRSRAIVAKQNRCWTSKGPTIIFHKKSNILNPVTHKLMLGFVRLKEILLSVDYVPDHN